MTRAAAVVLGLVLMAAAPPAASAGVEATASVTPDTVAYPSSTPLTFRLDLRTGAAPEQFAVTTGAVYTFGGRFEDGGQVEGWALSDQQSFRAEGEVALGFASSVQALPPCLLHGYEPVSRSVDVSMPPNASGALVVQRAAGATAPWPDTDYRLVFHLTNDLNGFGLGTLEEDRDVLPPPIGRSGPGGVRIVLSTDPESSRFSGARGGEIDAGTPVRFFGRTEPSLPGEEIRLTYSGPDDRERRLVEIARVTVGEDGRFEHAGWRPTKPGFYEVRAFYDSTRQDLVSDSTCPRSFNVRGEASEAAPPSPSPSPSPRPDPAPSPDPPTAPGPGSAAQASLATGPLRLRGRRRVLVPVRCAARVGRCRGSLVLRTTARPRHRLGSTRFDLAPGRSSVVVRARARRVARLRRSARPRVRVELRQDRRTEVAVRRLRSRR